MYVSAGFIVPREVAAEARAAVAAARGQATELKGATLLRTAPGRARLASLLRTFRELQCLPLFRVGEKRYAIAGKIVHTFIDPPYNDRVDNRITWDREWNQRLAGQLYGLSDASLTQMWTALRNPSTLSIDRALAGLLAACGPGQEELADLLAGAVHNVDDVVQDLVASAQTPAGRQLQSLAPTFVLAVLDCADEIAVNIDSDEPVVVHDATASFEPGIDFGFEMRRMARGRGGANRFRTPDGSVWTLGYRKLAALKFVDSNGEALVQAADGLAALMRSAPTTWQAWADESPELLQQYAQNCVAAFALYGATTPGGFFGSDEFLGRALEPFGAARERGLL